MPQRDWNNRSDILKAASEAQAAGDAQAFGMLSARLKELPPPKRDFGNMDDVRSALVEARIADDYAAESRLTSRLTELEQSANDPTAGMSRGEKLGAGLGASAHQTARGIGQITGIVSQEEVDEAAQLEAPLMEDAWGLGGNIVGHAGQVIAPAGIAVKAGAAAPRIAAAGKAVLAPATAAAGAGFGAAQSGIQPVATGESRLANAAIGAGAGAGGVVIPRVIGAGVRAAVPAVSRAMQERAAARAIAELSHDPAAVQRALASQPNAGVIIPGSRPTLAEMSGDVGLAGAQRTMQAASPEFNNRITAQGMQNNAARLSHLRGAFGGADETAAQAAEQARNQAAAPLLRAAQAQFGVEIGNVVRMADNIILARDKRPAVQAAVRKVRELLVDVVDGKEVPVLDIRRLINARQSIGDMLSGSAGADSDAARAAARELLLLRSAMDNQMRKVSPEYADWLRTYRDGSREADRIRIGAELTERGSPVPNSQGDTMLSPDKFARAASDMDAVARRVTGFRKARAATILTPAQQQVVDEVSRDLARYANVGREGRAVGSNTVQNLVGVGRVQDLTGPVAAGALTGEPTSALAVAGLNQLRKKYGEKTFAVLAEAMADPTRAAEVLARLPNVIRQAAVRDLAPMLLRQPPMAAAAAAAAAVPMDEPAY